MKSKLGNLSAETKQKSMIALETPTAPIVNNSERNLHTNLKRIHKLVDIHKDQSSPPHRYGTGIIMRKTNDTGKIIKLNAIDLIKVDKSLTKDLLIGSGSQALNPSSLHAIKLYPKAISLEKLSLTNKLSSINQIFVPSEIELKNLDMKDDLEKNYKILCEKNELKPKTWLENVLSLQGRKREEKGLTDDLRFCNEIFRDMIIRMKASGKENEGILIDKLWRYLLEVFDGYIELIHQNILRSEIASVNTIKAQEEIEKIRALSQRKVIKLEKEIERVKLDYILAKNPRKIIENNKTQRILPHIEAITSCIDTLYSLHSVNPDIELQEKKEFKRHFKSKSRNLLFLKQKRKKSTELPIVHTEESLDEFIT